MLALCVQSCLSMQQSRAKSWQAQCFAPLQALQDESHPSAGIACVEALSLPSGCVLRLGEPSREIVRVEALSLWIVSKRSRCGDVRTCLELGDPRRGAAPLRLELGGDDSRSRSSGCAVATFTCAKRTPAAPARNSQLLGTEAVCGAHSLSSG